MKHFYFLLGLLIVTFSCATDKSKGYMAFEDVIYIDKFPQSISVTNANKVEIDIIGILDITVQDSFLIISTNNREGMWSVFATYDSLKLLGQFITRGNGPNEFTYPPSFYDSRFYKSGDQLFAKIFDSRSGRLYDMNVSASVNNQKLDMKLIYDSLSNSMFTVIPLEDDNQIYCRQISHDHTQQNRYIKQKGENLIPDNMMRLNQAAIERDEDPNILSAIAAKKMGQDTIVEAAVYLNQLNIFSADGSLGKTLCVGKQLNSIEEIQQKWRWNRVNTYGGLKLYTNIWCALYIGETNKDSELGRKNLPVIQIFDWDGNALTEMKLDRNITYFDIDFKNGYLYTFDSMTDEFYRYNIKDKLQPEWV
ncbi:MAG: hypothetical protein ACRC26_05500 [Bacteroidales bacterium]